MHLLGIVVAWLLFYAMSYGSVPSYASALALVTAIVVSLAAVRVRLC